MTGWQDHSGDAVRQLLAEISAGAQRATAGPWSHYGNLGFEVFTEPTVDDDGCSIAATVASLDDAHFIATSRSSVPRLVAALTAVLDLHPPRRGFCTQCDDEWWPCPTYRAVAAALEEQP